MNLPPPSTVSILIVEDHLLDVELAARELKRAGIKHQMTRVETRDDFLYSIETLRPDLVLSDFSMPHFDGLSALELAREKIPDIPFIFVSGTIGEEIAIEALKRGAVDYILKSNLKRLGPAISRALQDVRVRQARQAAERQLNESRQRFELFMRYLPGAAFIKDRQGRYQFVNLAWEKTTGKTAPEAIDRTDRELWPTLAAQFEVHDRQVIENRREFSGTETFPQADGDHNYLVQKFPLDSGNGQMLLVGGIAVDITERLRDEEKIARLSRIHAVLSGINSLIVRVKNRQELFDEACHVAVEHGGFGIAWIGMLVPETPGVKPTASFGVDAKSFIALSGHSSRADLLEGHSFVGRAIREKRAIYSNDIARELTEGGERRREAARRGYRSLIALPLIVEGAAVGAMTLLAKEPGFFNESELKLLTALAGDISFALEHIEKDEKLNYLAYYDSLTGLPNRSLLCDRMDHFVRSLEARRQRIAVMTLNLERFRFVNDSFGRQTGDALLRLVGERLQDEIQEIGNAARTGADTFVVQLAHSESDADVAHFLEERIFRTLGEPFLLDGQELRVSFKCGIAVFPGDGENAEALLKSAEAALRKARETGAKYLFYAPQMNAQVAEVLTLENKLRVAITDEQFVLHYQPKVDLSTQRLVGLEALIRWNSPDQGLVPPFKFIPILEETGMILEAGAWALKRAAEDYRAWKAKGLPVPRIAVNLSALQLRQKDFVEVFETIVCSDGVPAGIDLEITESVIMEDIQDHVPKLKHLRERGVGIEIDDFGTGYSSLSYIATLPVTALKIDRSFIVGLAHNSDSMAIISAIISLAHSLNLRVVAEGVETDEQRKLLEILMCDTMQGYLFSKPIPAAEIEVRLSGAAGWGE